jgi:hypothetical protein
VKLFPPFRLDTVNECLWRASEAGAEERISLTFIGPFTITYLRAEDAPRRGLFPFGY